MNNFNTTENIVEKVLTIKVLTINIRKENKIRQQVQTTYFNFITHILFVPLFVCYAADRQQECIVGRRQPVSSGGQVTEAPKCR